MVTGCRELIVTLSCGGLATLELAFFGRVDTPESQSESDEVAVANGIPQWMCRRSSPGCEGGLADFACPMFCSAEAGESSFDSPVRQVVHVDSFAAPWFYR
jgi:hypothetical protein